MIYRISNYFIQNQFQILPAAIVLDGDRGDQAVTIEDSRFRDVSDIADVLGGDDRRPVPNVAEHGLEEPTGVVSGPLIATNQ